jgi:hypothetical protein
MHELKIRYIKCKKCDHIHYIETCVRDQNPSCFKCGHSEFTSKLTKQDLFEARRSPQNCVCNQALQAELEETTRNIAITLHKKYQGAELIKAIADTMMACINSTRQNAVQLAGPFFNNQTDNNK